MPGRHQSESVADFAPERPAEIIGIRTILAELDRSKVDQLALEFEGPALDPQHLKACKSKTVLFGCMFNSDDASETAEHVARRLLAAAEVLGPERIQAAPDCGLVMMSPRRAVEKLRIMVEGARLARTRI
jgi:methionine synthase II (cobalamin-independent)